MACKKGHRKPKSIPYGGAKGKYWCLACDADLVPAYHKPIKKTERQRAKSKIKKDKDET